jgi:hypothetical protein
MFSRANAAHKLAVGCDDSIDTNFLIRGIVMTEYPVCMFYKRFVPCTGIIFWFSGVWQSFVVDEVK